MRILSSVVYRLPFIVWSFLWPQTNISSGSKKRGHVSGVDSGPPQGSFGAYFLRQGFDPIDWAFPVGGLVTATVYWFLADPRAPKERASLMNQ
jgi:hypothetical protein